MVDLVASSLHSAIDWLTPTNPFEFENPLSSNDIQLVSDYCSILETEGSENNENAPKRDTRECTDAQSPLSGLGNLYSVDIPGGPDTSLILPLPVSGSCDMCKCTEVTEHPQILSYDARQPLYYTSTEIFESDMADSGSSRSHAEQSPGPRCALGDETICEGSSRRRSHNEVEKRYRQNLDRGFRHLKDTLRQHTEDKTNRMTRTEILDETYTYIVELRGKIRSLQVELKSLREALFPDTYKYTLTDSELL